MEQTTPSFLSLVDEAPVIFNISLEDLESRIAEGSTCQPRLSPTKNRLVKGIPFFQENPGW